MREIPLTHGRIALVDDIDYERLSYYKWKAHQDHGRPTYYAMANIKNKRISMHSLIIPVPKGKQTHHINHDGCDNRRCNLEIVTVAQNQWNQQKQIRKTSSQYKGVSWHIRDKRWRAKIKLHGIYYWLGYFKSEEEAAIAYNWAAIQKYGKFANLNIVHQ